MHCVIYGHSVVLREYPWRARECEMKNDVREARKIYAKAGRESKNATTFYMKREKSPLEPNAAHTGVHGELQHFRPDHDRVRRRSVQVPVTEIVGVLCAKDLMPTKNHVQWLERQGVMRAELLTSPEYDLEPSPSRGTSRKVRNNNRASSSTSYS